MRKLNIQSQLTKICAANSREALERYVVIHGWTIGIIPEGKTNEIIDGDWRKFQYLSLKFHETVAL